MIIPYDASKEERDRIVKERERKLYESFERMRQTIDHQIQTMNFSTVSERVKRQQLEEIRNKLQEQLQTHYNALESGLKDDMVNIGQDVLRESESFYTSLNMPIAMSVTSFPVEIMNNVVNGSVYEEKWYLSRALWGDYTEKIDQINEVISNGIGLNLPSLDIARQLEQYVDPNAMTPSKTIVTKCLKDPVTGKLYSMDYVKRHPEKDWTGFAEKNSYFRYGKVDYNAQRLARTLINHAYQQNIVHQAKSNPFATGVKWIASGGERMCEICEERDGKIFPADEVPLDHPNGMCTFEVVTDLSLMEMSDVLADFVNGVPTDYDDALYAWYNDRAETHEQKPVSKEDQSSTDKITNNFVPAKTKAEAVEYAKRFADDVNYSGISLENVNIINEQLTVLTEKYPINKLEEISNKSRGVMSGNFRSLNISGKKLGTVLSDEELNFKLNQAMSKASLKNYYERFPNKVPWDVQRRIEKLEDELKFTRWGVHSSYNDHVKCVVTHEYGHILSDQYFGMLNKERANPHLNENWGIREVSKRWDEVYSKAISTGDIYSLSQYGRTNVREFFAESFLAREMGEQLPDYVEKLMEETLKNGIL